MRGTHLSTFFQYFVGLLYFRKENSWLECSLRKVTSSKDDVLNEGLEGGFLSFRWNFKTLEDVVKGHVSGIDDEIRRGKTTGGKRTIAHPQQESREGEACRAMHDGRLLGPRLTCLDAYACLTCRDQLPRLSLVA